MKLIFNSNLDRAPGGSSSNFSLYFDSPLMVRYGSKIGISQATIPYTCTQFKLSNSIFWMVNVSTNDLIGFQIDYNRFYDSIDQVIEQINNISTSNSLDLVFAYVNNRVSITNNSQFIYRPLSSREFEPYWNGAIHVNGQPFSTGGEVFNQMQTKLGFITNYRGIEISPSGGVLTSDGIPQLLRTTCFYITCDGANDDYLFSNSSFNTKPVIARIPLQSNFGSLQNIVFNNISYFKINETTIDKLNFKILDDEFEDVNLNGVPVTLEIEIIENNN